MWEAHNSPRGQLRLLGLALLFLAISALAILRGLDEPTQGWVIAVGAIGVLMSLGASVIALSRSRQRRAVLRVNATGIVWERWSSEVIPWSEIAELKVLKVGSVWFLGARLHDPKRFPSRTILGRTASWNRALYGVDVAFETQGTDRSFEELVQAVVECSAGRTPIA